MNDAMLLSAVQDVLAPPALAPPVLSTATAPDPKLGSLYVDLTRFLRPLAETPHLTYPPAPFAPTLHSSSRNQAWPLLCPPGWMGGSSFVDMNSDGQTEPPDWFLLEGRILPTGPIVWWSAPPPAAYVRTTDYIHSVNIPLPRWEFPQARGRFGAPQDVFVRWAQLTRCPEHRVQTLDGDHGWLYDTPLTLQHNPGLMFLEISLPAPYSWPLRTIIHSSDYSYQTGSSAYNQHVTFAYKSSSHYETSRNDGPWEMATALDDLAEPCSTPDLLSFKRDLWWKISAQMMSCHTTDSEGGPCAVLTGGNLALLISRLWRAGWHPHAKCDVARISL
jgi:hypothetical protein